MKKIFYLASIAALAFSSCAKDETTEVTLGTVAGGEIVASVGDSDTRAYLDANQKFRWQDGDKLAVYGKGTYPMFNSTYAWKSGFTQGVFEGEKAFNADGNYLAVYPRHTTSLITETQWAGAWETNYAPGTAVWSTYLKLGRSNEAVGVTLEVPAEQKFMPGSFYQDIVPAMSTTFDVQEDGNAEVDMQPVADYLFVNIKATDPIKKLSLKLYDRDNNEWLNIAGKGNPIAYLLNGNVRYYLSNKGMDGNVIDLITNDYAADVTCHEPQTYVFVVPGGILGSTQLKNTNKLGIEAWIWVNEDDSSKLANATYANKNVDFIASSNTFSESGNVVKSGADIVSNTQMNSYYSNNGTPSVLQDDIYISREIEDDELLQDPMKVLNAMNMQMENMYFWMNPLNNGQRTSFTYNPNGAKIIENEAELLAYLTKYENGTEKVNAYICDNHHFDFSEANMKALSSELEAWNPAYYTEFQPYIDAYLNGSFPTITTYEHVFNGNNAVISGIVEPLKGMGGIFGNINEDAVIMDVTFDGIVADEDDADDDDMYPGVILGSMNGGKLSKVTVKNAEGMAILNKANSAALGQLAVEGVEGLNFIALDMDLNAGNGSNDYTKTWDVMSDVKEAVFGTLDATNHQIVALPAGADYADLAWYVSTANNNLAGNIYKIIAGVEDFEPVAAAQDDTNAVSVLVGATSVWTGDKIEPAHTHVSHSMNHYHAWASHQCIEYAEQLAGAKAGSAVVMRNLDMSYAVNSWEAPALNGTLEGSTATTTIKGISMDVKPTSFTDTYVAPFKAATVKNLVVDGVSINITTTGNNVVPQYIGGLAETANRVENVTVKDLVITGAGEGNNNEQYNSSKPTYIGWLVANPSNITVTNSAVQGVTNEIKGIAALVGRLVITNTNSAKFAGATASSVSTVQESLTNFVNFNGNSFKEAKANVAGTAVGLVVNVSGSAKSIEFTGSTGKPVFVFYNHDNSDINVLYDDSKVILKNGDKQYK